MLILAASCGKEKQAEPNRETKSAETAAAETTAAETTAAETTAAETTAAEVDQTCDDKSIEARFQACKASLQAYTKLEMPGSEVDCEALRLFAVHLAPLAQDLFKNITELKRYSQSQPDACRERNKAKYGAEMGGLMNELAKSMGPEMDRLEKRVRSCADHPGMAEAFEAASFPSKP